MANNIRNEDDYPFLSEINMIPLIDVSLVILIIFMIITPQMLVNTIKVKLPKSTSTEQAEPRNIVVTLDPAGAIYVNNEPVQLEALSAKVKGLMASKPDSAVVYSDKSIPISTVVDVIDQVKAGGMTNISITTEQKINQAVK